MEPPEKKKVCAVNGMICHHEVIGCVLASLGDAVVVFTTLDEPSGWFQFYAGRFPGAKIRPVHEYFPEEWDVTILLTDDDPARPEFAHHTGRVLSIEHYHILRRGYEGDSIIRAGTRYYSNRPDMDWFLPTYAIHEQSDKLAALQMRDDRRVHVACIGDSVNRIIPPWTFADVMKRRFSNASEICFHTFRRSDRNHDLCGNGLDVVDSVNAPAFSLLAALRLCDYIVILTGSYSEEEYCYRNITGAVPLAYATGCRLIFTGEMLKEYRLESPLVVEADAGFELRRPTSSDIAAVYDEAKLLYDRRDRIIHSVCE